MKIVRKGEAARVPAPAAYFTGTVWVDPVMNAPAPARVSASRVTFEAGARTDWHTHPLGQTLHVLSGTGFVQWKDGPAYVIHEGDSVWIGPDEMHAHGAAPESAMCHMAIQEVLPDRGPAFGGKVSEAEYLRAFS